MQHQAVLLRFPNAGLVETTCSLSATAACSGALSSHNYFGDPVGDGAGGVVFFKIGTRDMAAGMLALGGAAIANVAGLATGGVGGAVAGVATAVLAGLRSAISGTGGAGSVGGVGIAGLAWHRGGAGAKANGFGFVGAAAAIGTS